MLNLFFAAAIALSATPTDEPKLSGNVDAARAIAKADNDFAALAAKEGTAKAFAIRWMPPTA